MNLHLNGQLRPLPDDAVDADMPVLWVLREVLDLTDLAESFEYFADATSAVRSFL